MYKRIQNDSKILFGVLLLAAVLLAIPDAKAQWVPDSSQLAPIKDTYVSIEGALSNPTANYGLAETLTIGDGINGQCVTAIQFDLSDLPTNISNLSFSGDIVVYGDNTRTIKVNILQGVDWEETSVTGLSNPFNATQFWIGDYANLTTLTIGPSSDDLYIDLSDYLEYRGLITLVFAAGITDASWITLSAHDSSYLYSFSNPAHLDFVKIEAADDSADSSDDDSNNSNLTTEGESIPGYPFEIFIFSISLGMVLFFTKTQKTQKNFASA